MFLDELGQKPWGLVSYRTMRRRAKEVLQWLGLDVSPDRLVSELSVGEQQTVEIAAALSKEADVIIMDEPTAALTDARLSASLGSSSACGLRARPSCTFPTNLRKSWPSPTGSPSCGTDA